MTRLSLRAIPVLLTLGGVAAPAAAQAPETFNACFVPTVGAIYLIKRTGLPAACVASGHVEITWTGAGAPADGSITAMKLADGSVITIKLADGAVTSAKLATGAVGTAQISDGSVTVAKLGFDPATQAELDAISTVSLAGPGVATTAARSDHTHAVAGSSSTGVGVSALALNSGSNNTALGGNTLDANTTGQSNTAVGRDALGTNTSGSYSTAVGWQALGTAAANGGNTAVGVQALNVTTGSENTALGDLAGSNVGVGSNNIHIANAGLGGDNNTIKIGAQGLQTSTFIAGINSVTITGGSTVLSNSSGQLGTIVSSRRFKDDIQDMGDASRRLYDLRPVSFRYKQAMNDGSHPLEYGLIAEEVAEVFPELVVVDSTGQAQTVKYHVLPALLLNELQRQEGTIDRLVERVDSLEAALAARPER